MSSFEKIGQDAYLFIVSWAKKSDESSWVFYYYFHMHYIYKNIYARNVTEIPCFVSFVKDTFLIRNTLCLVKHFSLWED